MHIYDIYARSYIYARNDIYADAANWYFAGEGLSIRCIEEEGMNTWQDEKHHMRFDYFD